MAITVDTTFIHSLYRDAIAADEHYSKVLGFYGASRWEDRIIRAGRCARTQYLIKDAYQAKVKADADYHNACTDQRNGY